jgi:hypothetical protein
MSWILGILGLVRSSAGDAENRRVVTSGTLLARRDVARTVFVEVGLGAWPEPGSRLARIHWSPSGGRGHVADSRAYTGPWTDSYTETSDFTGKGTHLPSLPGSTALSCAPSGSSPRLSATRATPSRIARYHGHKSVTLAE